MSKYPLQALLELREQREQKAIVALNLAKLQYKYACEQKVRCALELEQFCAYHKQKKQDYYDSILNTVMTQNAMLEFNLKLANLSMQEQELKLKLEQAQAKEEQAKKQVNEANQKFINLHKALVKIQKHKDLYLSMQELEELRQSDLELEEFRFKVNIF